jgi:Pyruvate/2-oxoacid:ferredoxin oxidoreductase delta subunit/flavodoxin
MNSNMQKLFIYYFSGTGNAKRIAHWISLWADEMEAYRIIQRIDQPLEQIEFPKHQDDLIFFISPIHGFNYPKITLDFIRHFPKGNQKVVLMNTRAGMKIGHWITPGLTGIAFMLSAFWLKQKGYTVIGKIPYDMPSNWISLHPALNTNSVIYIHQKMHDRVRTHLERLGNGERLLLSRKDLIQDMLMAPISFLYYFMGRFIIAKTFYASPKCDDCGLCIKKCPVSAIKSVDGKPFWTVHCESCMRCMNFCPQKAIETSHGLLMLTTVLYTFSTGFLYQMVLSNWVLNPFLRFIVSNLLFFILLLVLYRLQHLLLKFKFTATLIQFTSLTFYRFWGRYQSIPDKVWKHKM